MLVDTHAHIHFEEYQEDLDIIFDNARIQIDMNQNKTGRTRVEHRVDVQRAETIRVADVFTASKTRRDALEGE